MEITDLEIIKNIDLYEILNITDKSNLTIDIIKKKYRKLALKYHPDKKGNNYNQEKFELIQLAYIILSNENMRKNYDEVYEINSRIKDFDILKKDFTNNNIISDEKISENDFKILINNINKDNNASLEILPILNEEESNKNVLELLEKRILFQEELYKKLIQENQAINKDDIIDFKKQFNETFDKSIDEDKEGKEEKEEKEITELVNYEPENKINKFASIENYNTMYSDSNEYDASFKIQKKIIIKDDNITFDEKIKKYKQETNLLTNIVKFNIMDT